MHRDIYPMLRKKQHKKQDISGRSSSITKALIRKTISHLEPTSSVQSLSSRLFSIPRLLWKLLPYVIITIHVFNMRFPAGKYYKWSPPKSWSVGIAADSIAQRRELSGNGMDCRTDSKRSEVTHSKSDRISEHVYRNPITKEIVTRYSTQIDSKNVSFTDANGRQVMKRL